MIAIIDYDMGNLYSLQSMLGYLNVDSKITRDPVEITQADGLILPGVGSFRVAIEKLAQYALVSLLKDCAGQNKPLLGICLGMQLLGNSSTEDGFSEGLGLVDGDVKQFLQDDSKPDKKIPHVGFNSVDISPNSRLLLNLPPEPDFYFTHSFCMQCVDASVVSSTADNHETFVASVERGNLFGAQFHPELSQTNGLQLMRNFVAICDAD